jgi:hypothetical protein
MASHETEGRHCQDDDHKRDPAEQGDSLGGIGIRSHGDALGAFRATIL